MRWIINVEHRSMSVENLPDKATRTSRAQKWVNQYQRERLDKTWTGHNETLRDPQGKNHSVEVRRKELQAETNWKTHLDIKHQKTFPKISTRLQWRRINQQTTNSRPPRDLWSAKFKSWWMKWIKSRELHRQSEAKILSPKKKAAILFKRILRQRWYSKRTFHISNKGQDQCRSSGKEVAGPKPMELMIKAAIICKKVKWLRIKYRKM